MCFLCVWCSGWSSVVGFVPEKKINWIRKMELECGKNCFMSPFGESFVQCKFATNICFNGFSLWLYSGWVSFLQAAIALDFWRNFIRKEDLTLQFYKKIYVFGCEISIKDNHEQSELFRRLVSSEKFKKFKLVGQPSADHLHRPCLIFTMLFADNVS